MQQEISAKFRVEIVAPVHNRKAITLQCLKSISRLNRPGFDIHTVIVDDGSTDGTSEAIREQFPDVEVVPGDGNLWFTEGTNVGVRAALKHNPKYVLMINDDQVFDADALAYMIETAENNERSVVGSLLLLWDTPHRLFQVAPVWETWRGGWRHWYKQTIWTVPERPWRVDSIVGNCVLVPKQAFDEAGLMDSKRYPNFGDAEFTPRLKKRGWELLIDPRARVFCQPNNLPVKVMKASISEKFKMLFVNTGHPHNLIRRFRSTWDSAPTRLSGTVAFFVFMIRLALRKNVESSWAATLPEKPMRETFRDRMV